MDVPYVTLQEHFVPKRWCAWYIGRKLAALTHSLGLIPLNDSIHGPQKFRAWCDEKLHAECGWNTYKGNQGEGWHQDGDLKPGSRMDNAMVLWANRTPTEFQYNGEIYQPRPFEVVLVRNLVCHHRRPDNAPKKRFLFRQRVEVPTHINLP